MRARTRVLALTALGVWLAAIAGCASSSSTRFYVLTHAAAPEKGPAKNPGQRDIAVGLRRVALPEYLDRRQIVTRVSPTQLELAEFDRWAAPLAEAFAGVLAENLTVMIPADRVAVFPWPKTARIDYEVAVDVMRFEGRLGGGCDLVARWSLFDRAGKEPVVRGRSSFTEPGGDTYEALVSAHSRLVAALSREIAAALAQVASTGSRAQGK
jgi:hypothetical protein